MEYGVYGSTDYGARSHLRWTANSVAEVKAYYNQFPFVQGHVAIIDSEDDAIQLTVCGWYIAFGPSSWDVLLGLDSADRIHPCELAKNILQERGGTIIEFSHDYFAG